MCNCYRTFRKVYEWFDSDITGRFGCYYNYDNDRRSQNKRISYCTVESYFDDSKRKYYKNCQIYANNFYDKLKNYLFPFLIIIKIF